MSYYSEMYERMKEEQEWGKEGPREERRKKREKKKKKKKSSLIIPLYALTLLNRALSKNLMAMLINEWMRKQSEKSYLENKMDSIQSFSP